MGNGVEILREEGRLVVRRRPDARFAWGCLGPLSLFLWLCLALVAGIGSRGHPIVLAGLGVVGGGLFLGILSLAASAWRVEATSDTVTLVKEGLLGERRRSWPAWDVASFWAAEEGRGETSDWVLMIGFGNGTKSTLADGRSDDLHAVAELLNRDRPKAPFPREAPPDASRPDPPEVLPRDPRLHRRETGFTVELLPVLGAWRQDVVNLDGGTLEVRGQGRWKTAEIDHVQAFADNGTWELRILLKDRSKARVLRGRPAGELDGLARFLRLAIRGPEEKLRVEAKEGTCQVCGEGMSTQVVTCARCRTPHHAECWTYVGQCSTYGCREIRAL